MTIFTLLVTVMLVSYGRCDQFEHEVEKDVYGGWLNIFGFPLSVIYTHDTGKGSEPELDKSQIKVQTKGISSEYRQLHGGILANLIGLTLFRNVDQYYTEGQTKTK